MKKIIFTLLLSTVSYSSFAGTGLNCSEDEVLSDANQLEACVTQTNDELNATYKQLTETHKDAPEKLEALKSMQLAWIKMRDAQCLFKSMNSAGGGGAAMTAVRCEVEMTIQREEELANL